MWPDLLNRQWCDPGARQTSVIAGLPRVFLNLLIKTSNPRHPFLTPAFVVLLSHCLSFYLFISNPAPFPLPPSSLHSSNFVLLLCALCCNTICANCFSLFCFLLPLSWFIHQFPSLSYFLCSFLLTLSVFVLLCITLPFPISLSPFPPLPLMLLFFPRI